MNKLARRPLLGLSAALAWLALSSCGRSTPERASNLDAGLAARRIVTVGSAITETVFALGTGDEGIAVDTSSLFPESASPLSRVGYQRSLSAEGILALTPTLVVASAEAGPPAALEQIKSAGTRVDVLPAAPSAEGARSRIQEVAEILGRDPGGVLSTLDADLARASALVARTVSRPKVLLLYARAAGSIQALGKETSADAVVRLSGGDNVITAFERSKPLSAEAIVRAAPDVILMPSRGLEALGGREAVLATPGIAETPAAKVVATLLLAGIAMNALASALTGLCIFAANDAELRTITYWPLGSLGGATWKTVVATARFVGAAHLILPRFGASLNALALGEPQANHLGFPVERTKRFIVALVALSVGASVAVTGVLSFVGLVVPHLLRLVAGPDHRVLLPGAALLGGTLLLGADALARTVIVPAELPLGIVTALFGTPLFLALLVRERRRSS